jgi:hypothetical protein
MRPSAALATSDGLGRDDEISAAGSAAVMKPGDCGGPTGYKRLITMSAITVVDCAAWHASPPIRSHQARHGERNSRRSKEAGASLEVMATDVNERLL